MTSTLMRRAAQLFLFSGLAIAARNGIAQLEPEKLFNPVVEQLWVQGRLIGREVYDRSDQKIGTIVQILRGPSAIEGVLVDLDEAPKAVAVPAGQIESRGNVLYASDLTRQGAMTLPNYD
jgi:hypothetical protein